MIIKHARPEIILSEVESSLRNMRFSDSEKDRYLDTVEKTLSHYVREESACTEFAYILRKRLGHLELKLFVPGEYDYPFSSLSDDPDDRLDRILSKLAVNRSTLTLHLYLARENIIIIRSPKQYLSTNIFKNPIVIAMLLGVLCGLLVLQLPENISDFIVDQVASPVFSLYTKMISGIMGPILFLSLVISISALDSISQLNTVGLKIIGRFVYITILLMVASGGISYLFFNHFRYGGLAFDADSIMEMLLRVVPTNLFTPFAENNLSQLMLIAFGLGASLLVLGERASRFENLLNEVHQCLATLAGFVKKLIPIIPFLGMFRIVAGNRFDVLLSAWKYLAVLYLCISFVTLVKWIKVSLRLRTNPLLFVRKMKPALTMGFSTASFSSIIDLRRTIATEELGIDPTFSNFWISMSYSLFNFSVPIDLIVSVLFISKVTGTPVSLAFFAMLAFMTFQLSIASPGMATSWTITFEELGIGSENVGLFTACNLFSRNYFTMCSVLFCGLEQVEAAYVNKSIDMERLKRA